MNLELARPAASPTRWLRPVAGGALSRHAGHVADCVTPIRSLAEKAGVAVDTEAA